VVLLKEEVLLAGVELTVLQEQQLEFVRRMSHKIVNLVQSAFYMRDMLRAPQLLVEESALRQVEVEVAVLELEAAVLVAVLELVEQAVKHQPHWLAVHPDSMEQHQPVSCWALKLQVEVLRVKE
jgi:hypothetical protein